MKQEKNLQVELQKSFPNKYVVPLEAEYLKGWQRHRRYILHQKNIGGRLTGAMQEYIVLIHSKVFSKDRKIHPCICSASEWLQYIKRIELVFKIQNTVEQYNEELKEEVDKDSDLKQADIQAEKQIEVTKLKKQPEVEG